MSSVFSVDPLEAARGEQLAWHWCVLVVAAGVAVSLLQLWFFLLCSLQASFELSGQVFGDWASTY